MDMHIATMHASRTLTIHNVEALAEAFFRYDPSSARVNSYDNWIAQQLLDPSQANRITADDIHAINRTMAARSKLEAWQAWTVMKTDFAPLAAISPTWDLFTLSDSEWRQQDCQHAIQQVIKSLLGPYRNIAVATKVLHAKRPHVIPVLDSYVVQMLGGPAALNATSATHVITHLRAQGRANLDVLQSLQESLRTQKLDRSLVRILDAVLWLSHPGALGSPAYKHLTSAEVTIAVQ